MKKKEKNITIGVSGDQGSFSEEAAMLYAANTGKAVDLKYLIDMERVLSTLEHGKINLGVFPVVNSRGGLVHAAFAAMGQYKFKMIDEIWLNVKQCLLAKKGITPSGIKVIASHPQALVQCERYLEREFPKTKLLEWEDTAKAARDLTRGKLPRYTAVIAPARSATLYGLTVLAHDIQDVRPNFTTFIVVENYEDKK